MKQIRCGDVVPGCDYVAQAETEPELLILVAEHARSVHGVHEVTPELATQIRAKITEE